MKPICNNITTFEKYIICKNFHKKEVDNLLLNHLKSVLKNLQKKQTKNILKHEIPYYFRTKINDINIILGQQQLESFDLLA
jgi:hypothetical protein